MGIAINYGDHVWITNMSIGDGSQFYLRIGQNGGAIVTAGTDYTWEIISTRNETGPVAIKTGTSFYLRSVNTGEYLYATSKGEVGTAPLQSIDGFFFWIFILFSGPNPLENTSQVRIMSGLQSWFLDHTDGLPACIREDSPNGWNSDLWVCKLAGTSPSPTPAPSPSPAPNPSPSPSPSPSPAPAPFNLPPNTPFGVTVQLNSADKQTISVYLDDNKNPAYNLVGQGRDNDNRGTVILISGTTGNVRIAVYAQGNACALITQTIDASPKSENSRVGLVAASSGESGANCSAYVVLTWKEAN